MLEKSSAYEILEPNVPITYIDTFFFFLGNQISLFIYNDGEGPSFTGNIWFSWVFTSMSFVDVLQELFNKYYFCNTAIRTEIVIETHPPTYFVINSCHQYCRGLCLKILLQPERIITKICIFHFLVECQNHLLISSRIMLAAFERQKIH